MNYPLFDPADFRIPAGIAHVCAGGETAFLHRHDAALARYAADKSHGIRGRNAQDAEVMRARSLIAGSWGVGSRRYRAGPPMSPRACRCWSRASTGSPATTSSSIRTSILRWSRPSPCSGTRISTSAPPAPGMPRRWRRSVDARTRLVAVSDASYPTGERYDLAAMRQVADRVGALLAVDYTQAAGYLPVDPHVADFAFAATYKWLLGMTGTAIAYWNRERQPDWAPSTAGWNSIDTMERPDYAAGLRLVPDAMRFARGNPGHGAVYVLASALDFLGGFAPGSIQAHVRR